MCVAYTKYHMLFNRLTGYMGLSTSSPEPALYDDTTGCIAWISHSIVPFVDKMIILSVFFFSSFLYHFFRLCFPSYGDWRVERHYLYAFIRMLSFGTHCTRSFCFWRSSIHCLSETYYIWDFTRWILTGWLYLFALAINQQYFSSLRFCRRSSVSSAIFFLFFSDCCLSRPSEMSLICSVRYFSCRKLLFKYSLHHIQPFKKIINIDACHRSDACVILLFLHFI